MKKRVIGLILFLLGGLTLSVSRTSSIGAVIGALKIPAELSSVFSMVLTLIGLIFMVSKEEGKLEDRVGNSKELGIKISNLALRRTKKDARIKNNLGRYQQEIKKIVSDPATRPKEKLGEFLVSPRGGAGAGIRVAWHIDNGKLYIDDFLYHNDQSRYVDDWAGKVRRGEIDLKYYKKGGYTNYS